MAKGKQLKVVIDTNLWISFLISKRQDRLGALLKFDKIQLLFSNELLEEISATIAKPKLTKYFQSNALDEMLSTLEDYIILLKVTSHIVICRDPKDNFLLALAKDGKADFLLTGDKDLLELQKMGKTQIITISHFFEMCYLDL